MAETVIVTDSTADLPEDIRNELGIVMVPLKINVGDKVYRDGVDISSLEFFKVMESGTVVPTTSQPSPGEFVKVYEQILSTGREIISMHISSEMSGTYHSANIAKEMLNDDRIHIVDSQMVSLALGLLVIKAAEAAREGLNHQEIIDLIGNMIQKTRTYFLVDTLEYLARGGRIGKAQSLLGTLLNIKPILTFKDGVIYPYDKVRGFNKAVQRIIESIKEEFGDEKVTCAFVHGSDMEVFGEFYNKISAEIDCLEVVKGPLGPVVCAHAGPGIIGVICYSE